jgi:hypothetical protein
LFYYAPVFLIEEVGSGMSDSRAKLNRLFKLAIDRQISRQCKS